MPEEKVERNKAFAIAWKEEGLSNKQLEEKFNLSPGGVKGLKARLRKRDSSLYTKQRPEESKVEEKVAENSGESIKSTSKPAIQQANKLAEYKKVTYYLDPGMVKKIKILAAQQDKEISQLVREIFSGYFDKH